MKSIFVIRFVFLQFLFCFFTGFFAQAQLKHDIKKADHPYQKGSALKSSIPPGSKDHYHMDSCLILIPEHAPVYGYMMMFHHDKFLYEAASLKDTAHYHKFFDEHKKPIPTKMVASWLLYNLFTGAFDGNRKAKD